MAESSDKPKSDRRKIINWYRLDLDEYREQHRKYSRLIEGTEDRIRELEILEIDEGGF